MLETLSLSLTPSTPLDPNFVPPTRPPSALSTRSDASFFALYDAAPASSLPSPPPSTPSAHPAPEALPRRTVFATIRRHGQQCLLCGRRDIGELVVVRAVMQHTTGDTEDTGETGETGEGSSMQASAETDVRRVSASLSLALALSCSLQRCVGTADRVAKGTQAPPARVHARRLDEPHDMCVPPLLRSPPPLFYRVSR